MTPACYPAEENATSTLNETTVDDDDGSTIGGTLLHYAMDTMAGLHNETGLEGSLSFCRTKANLTQPNLT